MKMDDNLNKLFNIEPIQEIKKEDLLPIATVDSVERKEDDFDLARNTMRNLIHKNEAVLTDLVDLARNSESARAYEVAGQLIKTQAEMAKDLMTLHKQKKDIDGERSDSQQNIKTQNNIVFAGSTADLMKMIAFERAKTIDSK
jgi:hypothetical protein